MGFYSGLFMPFQFDFMVNAFIIAMVLAVPAALLSCFLVLKGWSLMGDAISHAVFPGVVLAYMFRLPLAVGAFAAGMFCAIASGFLKANSRIRQDTVMGVVFSGMFGLGLVMHVAVRSEMHLDHILFGDLLGVGWPDIVETTVIAAGITGVIGLKWKDYLLYVFDPVQARIAGLSVKILHYSFLCMISLAVVGALKAVGIVFTIAILIVPGATAFLLARTFSGMLLVAVIVAVSASFLGIYLSFYIDSAPAPTIIVVFFMMFLGVLAWHFHKTALGKSDEFLEEIP